MCKIDHSLSRPVNISPSPTSLSSFLLPSSLLESSPLCQAAFSLAQIHLHPSILNQSIRVFSYAWHLAQHGIPSCFDNLDPDFSYESNIPLLFSACILHDI